MVIMTNHQEENDPAGPSTKASKTVPQPGAWSRKSNLNFLKKKTEEDKIYTSCCSQWWTCLRDLEVRLNLRIMLSHAPLPGNWSSSPSPSSPPTSSSPPSSSSSPSSSSLSRRSPSPCSFLVHDFDTFQWWWHWQLTIDNIDPKWQTSVFRVSAMMRWPNRGKDRSLNHQCYHYHHLSN